MPVNSSMPIYSSWPYTLHDKRLHCLVSAPFLVTTWRTGGCTWLGKFICTTACIDLFRFNRPYSQGVSQKSAGEIHKSGKCKIRLAIFYVVASTVLNMQIIHCLWSLQLCAYTHACVHSLPCRLAGLYTREYNYIQLTMYFTFYVFIPNRLIFSFENRGLETWDWALRPYVSV